MLDRLVALGRPNVKVLFHAASIGAEVYSFLIYAALRLTDVGAPKIRCFVTDVEPEFLDRAQEGIYPIDVLTGMRPEERIFFKVLNKKLIRVHDALKDAVTFLEPASFVDYKPTRPYDMVVALNALLHVDGPSQTKAIKAMAASTDAYLVISGFHMDRIKRDIVAAGLKPVVGGIEKIHGGWHDRLSLPAGYKIPGVTHYTPALKPFEIVRDFEYKYCAVFAKPEIVTVVDTDDFYAGLVATS